jgi:serpin B
MKWKILFPAIVIAAVLLGICLVYLIKPGRKEGFRADDSKATPEKVRAVVGANNEFAFDLFSKYRENYPGKNIFFSPYSISTAIAMTFEGAKEKTAWEIQNTLHFPKDCDTRTAGFAKIYNQMNRENDEYELRTANALWTQKNYEFLEGYLRTVERYYGGKATGLDFQKDSEGSRRVINSWVEDQTNNKIKDLIPEGAIDTMTRLILTNAVYFMGYWDSPFDEKNTVEGEFRVNPKEMVKVPMMYQTGQFNYAETEEYQILEMPYSGENLSMLVVLPREGKQGRVEESLTSEKLEGIRGTLRIREVAVGFPKFKIETKYFMKDTLEEMGMPSAFSKEADFSGMTGSRDLFISMVVHQAFVEVTEKGTEAAAATGVEMEWLALPPEEPVSFRADHPFLFVILQNDTGNIVFLGRVTNPAE